MKNIFKYILIFCCALGFSQDDLATLLDQFNNESIPYISVQELAMPSRDAIILDAREQKEFDVSHLKGAIHVGYEAFNLDIVRDQVKDKSQNIVVYCTLGVRSEDIAEKIKAAGYTNVQNLYGGIVEWKNKDFKVFNPEGKETEKVHVCNEYWSKWLTKGEKVYE